MTNDINSQGRRIAIRWLLFVLFMVTVPAPWFVGVAGGLLPALQMLMMGLYLLLQSGTADNSAFTFLFLISGLIAAFIYYLLASLLAYPLASIHSPQRRTSILILLSTAMLVMASFPIYYMGGHNTGQALSLLDYKDSNTILFFTVLICVVLLITVLLYLQYRDVAIRGLWKSPVGKGFVLLVSSSFLGVLINSQFAPWVCLPAAKLGFSSAQVCMGRALASGRITHPSPYQQSIQWYQQAAEQGNVDAARELYALFKSVKWLRQIAESGDHAAQYELSQQLSRQFKKQAKKGESQRWLVTAADNGNANAQYDLFNLLLTGDETKGIDKDLDESLRRLKQAAAHDHQEALATLSKAYQHGQLGLPLDLARAESLQKRLVQVAKSEGVNKRDSLNRQQAELDSIRILKNQIQSSDPHALKKLAFDQLALRTADASQRALDYLEKAAAQDDAGAQYELGKIYAHGADHIPKDATLAAQWWAKSAENLHVQSMQELASLYRQGRPGVERDYQKAEYYMQQVIQSYNKNLNDDMDSQKNLSYWQGQLDELQQLIKRTPDGQFAPLEALRRYATGGEVQAQFQLAQQLSIMHAYSTLRGEESLYWLEKAAVGGHSEAQWKMFQHKSRGIMGSRSDVTGAQTQVVMPKNNKEALRYLKMAAANHHPQAMRELSLSYAQGRHGLPIDLEESLRTMTELVAAQEDNRYGWDVDQYFKSNNRRFLVNAKNSIILAEIKRQREANIGAVSVQLLAIESQARTARIKKLNDQCPREKTYECRQKMSQQQKDKIIKPINEQRDRRIQAVLDNAAELDKAIWKQVKQTQQIIERRRKTVLDPLIKSQSKDYNKVQYQLFEEQLELFKERDKKINALKIEAGLELNQ